MNEKRCSQCTSSKPRSEFYRQTWSKDGLHAWCKECFRAAERDRRLRNPEKVRAGQRRKYAAAKAGRKLRTAPEPGSADWANRYRWSRCISAAKQQAKRFGADVNDLTLDDWLDVVESQGRACYYCAASGVLWIEHVVALFNGGRNTKTNVVASCEDCNRRTSKKSAEDFLEGNCHRGHPLWGSNLYVYPNGVKMACKTCRRESSRRYRTRRAQSRAA